MTFTKQKNTAKHAEVIRQCTKRRLKAIKLYRNGVSQATIAKKLKVTPSAVCQWIKEYEGKGIKGVASKGICGPKPCLTEKDTARIMKALVKGPRAYGFSTDLWNLPRLGKLIQKTTRASFKQSHVSNVLHSLGWTCQKPVVHAKQRNEKVIQMWTKVEWPRLKKIC